MVQIMDRRFSDIGETLEIVDLSHTLENDMPIGGGQSFYYHCPWGRQQDGAPYNSAQIITNEHNGTHLDAPGHFVKVDGEQIWVDEIPIDRFFAPCVVIEASELFPLREGRYVSKAHIIDWENVHGPIAKNSAVLMHTGWDEKWALMPNHGEYLKNWPSIDESAAEYLIQKEVKIYGTDTISVDAHDTENFPVHHLLLGKKIVLIEALTNLSQVRGPAYLIAMALKIGKGTGSPVRAVAMIERERK